MYLSSLLSWKAHRSHEMFGVWQSRRKTEKEMAFNLASCYVYLHLMWD